MTTTYTPSKLIQLIHVGKSKLMLDDGTYRHMLTELTGKSSTKDMTKPQLISVLDAMKERGFTPTKPKRAGKLKQADDPQSRKIRSLWLQLHEAGAVRNSSERALAAYVERQTGKSALQFLSTEDASKVIESLKQWQNRLKKDA